MSRTKAAYVGIGALVLAAAVFFAAMPGGKGESDILVLCGGSMRAAMEEIVEKYRAVSDDSVVPSYGSSGSLAAQIKLTREGDVFVCHDPWIVWAEERGLVGDWRTVARLEVVIAVPEGNPEGIRSLDDLARPGLRLGLGSPDHSTSGIITKEILKRHDKGEAIRKNAFESRVHGKRSTDLSLGLLDAAIIWNAVAHTFRDKLDAVPVESRYVDAVTSATYGRSDLKNVRVTMAITKDAADKEHVRRFWEFATTEGRKVFARHGFSPPKETTEE